MKFNRDFKKAPKDGTECIFWVSSTKGFPDQTANFHYAKKPRSKNKLKIFKIAYPEGEGWYWSDCVDAKLKRPDLVKGWMIYPQPPLKAKGSWK
ncbi:MAG: hypothetical protein ACAH80_17215, partial [Alphaproteobacteria bacterium]